ncbi:MAG: anion permease [Desulfovermiculus sp.]
MNIYDLFFFFSLVAGFLMAFNLGANDVANAMASAVGAKAISVKQAVFIAGTLNFVGAVFLGSHVTATVSKGIINADQIGDPQIMLVGMLASLLAAALWVFIATLTALPVSSTHSIIGSILGFGLIAMGPGVVNWLVLGGVVLSWIISPFFAAAISFTVFSHIRRFILVHTNFFLQALRWAPIWMALTAALILLSFLYKTPIGKQIPVSNGLGLVGILVLVALIWFISKRGINSLMAGADRSAESVEFIFRKIQVGTSCYVALSQGANDVANAIGPVAAIYIISRQHAILEQAQVPMGILALGGLGIALGIMVFGRKVMATVGTKITSLTNTRGFSVDFGAATTVLAASNLGLPVSTTHAAVGGVVGVGLARGFSAVDFGVLLRIIVYWILTVPIAAFTSIVLYNILSAIFL